MLVSPSQGYTLWAPTYNQDPNPMVALESRIVAGLLGDLREKHVLDVACGTGRWSAYARNRGAKAFGIDRCSEMLALCSTPAALADAQQLPVSSEWADITICALALGYMESAMNELVRVTKPGGSIFVSDMHPKAADRGWSHSFRRGSETYEIEYHHCDLPELLETSGLRLKMFLEPAFGAPELKIFQRAGKESRFDEMRKVPAIFVAQWIRM